MYSRTVVWMVPCVVADNSAKTHFSKLKSMHELKNKQNLQWLD